MGLGTPELGTSRASGQGQVNLSHKKVLGVNPREWLETAAKSKRLFLLPSPPSPGLALHLHTCPHLLWELLSPQRLWGLKALFLLLETQKKH